MIDGALLNWGQEKDMSGDGCGGRVQECWEKDVLGKSYPLTQTSHGQT